MIVGVSTDELVLAYKHHLPTIPYEQRKEIVEAIKYVDLVVPQTSMNKLDAWEKFKFNALFHGDDWKGSSLYNQIEKDFKKRNVDIVFIKHTEGISSTIIKATLGK